jgi:hypothetical protein
MIREIRFGVVCESVVDVRLGQITRPRRGHGTLQCSSPITPGGRVRPATSVSTIMAARYFLRALSCMPRMPSVPTGNSASHAGMILMMPRPGGQG